jgi:hypothetical protein
MEQNFKMDVLRELRAGDGRILLHDEVEDRPGVFSIVPQWETVSEEDIMTPRDVFDLMSQEGFKASNYRSLLYLVSLKYYIYHITDRLWSNTYREFSDGVTKIWITQMVARLTSRHHFPVHSPNFWSALGLVYHKLDILCSIAKWVEGAPRREWLLHA